MDFAVTMVATMSPRRPATVRQPGDHLTANNIPVLKKAALGVPAQMVPRAFDTRRR